MRGSPSLPPWESGAVLLWGETLQLEFAIAAPYAFKKQKENICMTAQHFAVNDSRTKPCVWPQKLRPRWEVISAKVPLGSKLSQHRYSEVCPAALRPDPDTRGALYLGMPELQFLVSSKSHGGEGCEPSKVVVVAWELSVRSARWVLWQVFVSDLSSWHCAVQGGVSQVGALLRRAFNEIVGAAGKMPQDLSEAERVHTLGCKT